MAPVDTTIIRRKGEELEKYVTYLREFEGMPLEKFVSDHHTFGLAEHYLEHAIEGTLDIARTLVAGLDLPMPDEAHELFARLTDAGIVPQAFSAEHQAMVGLRNRLVHEYATVDHARVHAYIQQHLDAFGEFLDYVRQYVRKDA